MTRNTLWTANCLEWRQKSWSFKNAVNDTVHEMLDLNHKSSSAQVSATTKKNMHPNQKHSRKRTNLWNKQKEKKGPVTKSLTCETVPIIKHICTKLWLYSNVHYEKRISFMKIDLYNCKNLSTLIQGCFVASLVEKL